MNYLFYIGYSRSIQRHIMSSMNTRLLLLLIFLTLLACTHRQKGPVSVKGAVRLTDDGIISPNWPTENSVVVLLSDEPTGLHPVFGSDNYRAEVFNYLHRTLVSVSTGGAPRLVLLNSLPVASADSLSYSCVLKEGIFWDDGRPITASDVLFTFKVNSCPLIASQLRMYWNRVVQVTADQQDPLKFSYTVRNRDLLNISFLADFPLLQRDFHDPDHVLERYSFEQLTDPSIINEPRLLQWAATFNDDSNGRLPEKINGLGSYRLDTWKPREQLTLVRKKNASETLPDKIIYRFAGDETGTVLELKQQSYDVACYLSTKGFRSAAADPSVRNNYHCVLTPTYGNTYLAFNERASSFFNDISVRRAVSQMIPCDAIIRQLYGDYANEILRMGSNVSPLKTECDTLIRPVGYDPDAGSRLLERSGWEDRNGDGWLDKNGQLFCVRLLHRNSSADWSSMATLIADALSKAGIKVEIIPTDNKIFGMKAVTGDFDLLLGSMGGAAGIEDFSQCWSTSSIGPGGKNYSAFGNIDSDRLIDSINTSTDATKRIRMSKRLQHIIYDDRPCLFLYNQVRRNIVHKRWANVVLFPDRPGIRLDELRKRN